MSDIDDAVNTSAQSESIQAPLPDSPSSNSSPSPRPEAAPGPDLPPRELGRIVADRQGSVLVVIAGLHGNERSGLEALEIIFNEFADLRLDRGMLVGLTGNRRALARGVRYLAEDLNRAWLPARVQGLREGRLPVNPEESEITELDRALRTVRREGVGGAFVLDLHSTSGPGKAFTTLDDSLVNRDFAFAFPVPSVVGLEEELSGTMLGYLTHEGWTNACFESGQHEEEEAIVRARAAIWIAMQAAGLVDRGTRPEVRAAYDALHAEHRGMPRVVAVRSRRHIDPEDDYRSEPGLASFQAVREGQILGHDHHGPVRAAEDSLLLMPLYQEQGHEGYFLARPVHMFWLRLSALLRRLRLDRIAHWLPGVQRHPNVDDTFIVNRRYARWQTMEIFHLFGFRRVGVDDDRLIVERR